MRLVTLALFALMACGGREAPPRGGYEDPAQLLEAARRRPLPEHLSGSYGIHVESKLLGIDGTTRGGLLVQRPDRFRLDVLSPFGTPLVYAVSDGVGFGVFLVSKNTLYTAADAEALLLEVSGGAAGLRDITAVLVGEMPFAGREVSGVQAGEGETVFSFAGPGGTRAEVALDDRDATTRRIVAYDPAGAPALTASYADYQRVADALLPGEVLASVPALQLEVKLSFRGWSVPAAPQDLFGIPAATGSEVVDLNELVRKAKAGELSLPAEP